MRVCRVDDLSGGLLADKDHYQAVISHSLEAIAYCNYNLVIKLSTATERQKRRIIQFWSSS